MGRGSSGIKGAGSGSTSGSGRKLSAALKSVEDSIRGNKTESAVGLDLNGNILFNTSDGASTSVTISLEQMDMLKGQILTHNHPHGYMFSDADIGNAIRMEVKQVRATTPDGRAFVLERTVAAKPGYDLYYAYAEMQRGTAREATEKTLKSLGIASVYSSASGHSLEEISHMIGLEHTKVCNKWLSENAPKYGYAFREE